VDLSALIFVALAVAWAVYLIPKALKQHEDSAASRSIDGFSDRLRVLARREPVDARTARLVVHGARAEPDATVTVTVEVPTAPVTPAQVRSRRAAAARAAKRRLRVVCTILLAVAVVGTLAVLGVVAPAYTFIPVGVLVAWLVACRLMVRSERASTAALLARPGSTPEAAPEVADDPATEEIAVVHLEADVAVAPPAEPVADPEPAEPEAEASPDGWDPVPVTLPTYVGKEPAARRTVRTIDLDSTGVWTSGPLASDSALARQADEADRSAKDAAAAEAERRASGS
jgi:hypothetical protein